MNGPAYYNEFDPVAAEWLRWLIAEGHIAPGFVDGRSIELVRADELAGFQQVHLFAGIGGWSLAARLAGWPDDRPLWTASCPCQPFSVAGKGAGRDDARHLWPHVLRLASAARPAVLVGEQVAGKAGYDWFDGVAADLEGEGYACRAVDIPACAVDAPHIRQRQYWVSVANSDLQRCGEARELRQGSIAQSGRGYGTDSLTVANPNGSGRARRQETPERQAIERTAAERADGSDMGHPDGDRSEAGIPAQAGRQEGLSEIPDDADRRCLGSGRERHGISGRNGTFWSGAEWITCHDGKARRTEPGISLLAHGVPGRVAAWRGFGNAIVPPLAAGVIGALMDVLP